LTSPTPFTVRLGRDDRIWEAGGPIGFAADLLSEEEPLTERTLVLVKPDAVRRGLIGEVVGRFERKGLAIDAMALRTMDGDLADRHYAEHVRKPVYPPLREFMTGGPLVAMIVSGDRAIEVVRLLAGPTDGRAAPPGTIRGDLSLSNRENLVHASDSADSAKREIALWFPELA
jgi:nucleoside-diphosphate kinase